jgi:hypothetical protein
MTEIVTVPEMLSLIGACVGVVTLSFIILVQIEDFLTGIVSNIGEMR